jgi:4-hydroxybenzoate polyprenyltransferase
MFQVFRISMKPALVVLALLVVVLWGILWVLNPEAFLLSQGPAASVIP